MMFLPVQTDFLIPCLVIFLYTEMHYRFKYFPFSRYFRREPEILADAPFRLDPGKALPILILVKDADKFPIILTSIDIELTGKNEYHNTFEFKKDMEINDRWWYETLFLKVNEYSGSCEINVTFTYEINGKIKSCINHNLKTSPVKSLTVFISNDSLPGVDKGWYWGDLHYHSSYTEDFVEFGAPLIPTKEAGKALGLSFVCISDHSYDLDDVPGIWNKMDPELIRWKQFQNEIRQLNQNSNPLLIPSEEVTTTNSKGKNVHTLVLNHPHFIPGSGDDAEKWFITQNEYSINEIIHQLSTDSLAIAAHPLIPFTFLERVFLNRSQWESEDLSHDGISGYQILNGHFSDYFEFGLQEWIKALLSGKKKFIYAGNDAHGNFNRFRQISTPMISTWDNVKYILGKCRTGVLLEKTVGINSIITALKKGKCVISDGPLLSLIAENDTERVTLGDTINVSRILHGGNIKIKVINDSTIEFGELKEVTVFMGDFQSSKEVIIFSHQFDSNIYTKTLKFSYDFHQISGYIRGRLVSSFYETDHYCYTNPVWINQ